MKQSVKNTIFQAIIGYHWLDIIYLNSKGETTHYYFGVSDIDIRHGLLKGDVFNAYKDSKCLPQTISIHIDKIQTASVVEQSYYPVSKDFMNKITTNPKYLDYLSVSEMDNNILRYLSDCYKNDNDPFIKDKAVLENIDIRTLEAKRKIQLDDQQFNTLLEKVFKNNELKSEFVYRYAELAMNRLAIDIGDKTYVIAYRRLLLNFKDHTLAMARNSTINKSFLIDDKKYTLTQFLTIDPDEFAKTFDEKYEEYKQDIEYEINEVGKINTRAQIFLIRREAQLGVDEAFDSIFEMEKNKNLTHPLKSFFGRNKSKGTSKEFNIVVFDKNKINIDQMRVIYNSMCNHTTFVKGPPGTGKTETIFNVLLSAYYNGKSVLVCSNNNHPVDDIYNKMNHSFTYRKGAHGGDDEENIFPIIRMGNKDENKLAIIRLKEFLQIAEKYKKTKANEEMTEQSKAKSLGGFESLRKLLQQYEEAKDIQFRVDHLQQMLTLENIGDQFKEKIYDTIETSKERLRSFPNFRDQDFADCVISANDSSAFKNYIHYSSLLRIKKLNNEAYKDLKEIIQIKDVEIAASELVKYLKDDKNLKRFLDIFPIVVTTNLSSDKLGSANPHFDLCIMDEAGQCNTAVALIPIVRADNLLLVGDTNQLQPVTVIELALNEKFKSMYGVKDEYDYVDNSILSTMLRMDNNSKSILLRYHYRCGKKIAGFVNQRFYDQALKLKNENEGVLTYYDVKNVKDPDNRNAYKTEASEVVKIIKENKYKDVGIITPFRKQAELINAYLKKAGITHCKAGTIHTLQGSEKPVIILSSALSLKTGKKTMDWIKNNAQLINVGVTRAKQEFIFVGDKEAIDTLSGGENNDLKALSDYVYQKGEVIVPKSTHVIQTDFSNNSESEKEFFETIQPYFARKKHKFIVERNVPVKEALKAVTPEEIKLMGKKEFDLTVKVNDKWLSRKYQTILVFEIDGGEHIGSNITARRDRAKEDICKRYGVKLIRIPNHKVKDYELIINMFEAMIAGIKDIDEMETISLFDE